MTLRGESSAYLEHDLRTRERGRECWDWPFGRTDDGYGQVRQHDRVHMLALRFDKGPPPPDKPIAMHTCHRPCCYNPLHLRWGTVAENNAEARERGSSVPPPTRRGESNGRTRLSDDEVAEIRAAHAQSTALLARRFNVDPRTIRKIVSGQRRAEAAGMG